MNREIKKNFEGENINIFNIIALIWNSKYVILSSSGIITLLGLALFIFAGNGLKLPERYIIIDIKKAGQQLGNVEMSTLIKIENIRQASKTTKVNEAVETIANNLTLNYGNDAVTKLLNQVSAYTDEGIQKKFASENSYKSIIKELKNLDSDYGQIRLNIMGTSISEESGKNLVIEIVKNGENNIKQQVFYDKSDYFFETYENYYLDPKKLNNKESIFQTYIIYNSTIKRIEKAYANNRNDIAEFKNENLQSKKREYDYYLKKLITSNSDTKDYLAQEILSKITAIDQNIMDNYDLFEVFNSKQNITNVTPSQSTVNTTEGINALINLGAKLSDAPLNNSIVERLKSLLDEKNKLDQDLKMLLISQSFDKTTDQYRKLVVQYINDIINGYNDYILTKKNLLENQKIFEIGVPYILDSSGVPKNTNLFFYVLLISSLLFSTFIIIIRKYFK